MKLESMHLTQLLRWCRLEIGKGNLLGSNFASGVYFYRIKAGDPSANHNKAFYRRRE